MSEQYKVFTGDIITDPDFRRAHLVNDSVVERRIRFVNASTKVVYIASVDGSIITMKPSLEHGLRDAFMIIHETFTHKNELNWIDGSEDPAIREIRLNAIRTGRSEWEEIIPIEEIDNQRSGVYLRMHDVVLSTHFTIAHDRHHPRCRQFIHNEFVKGPSGFDANTMLGVIVRMVDNSGNCAKRFTVFHDTVQVLTPIIDSNMRDGIYITGLVEIDAMGNRTKRNDEYYTFEQVDKGEAPIRLFTTVFDANASKDELALRELEAREAISKRDHERIMLESKREFEKLKHGMDKNAMEKEQQLKERLWEIEKLKGERDDLLHGTKHHRNMESESYSLQIAAIKAQQEKMSQDQKTFTETIKMISVGAAAFLAIKTLMG